MAISLPKLTTMETDSGVQYKSETRPGNPSSYGYKWFEGVIAKNRFEPEQNDLGLGAGIYVRGLLSALYGIRLNFEKSAEYFDQRGFKFSNLDPSKPFTFDSKKIAELLRTADVDTLSGYYTWDPSTITTVDNKAASPSSILASKSPSDYLKIFSNTTNTNYIKQDNAALKAFYSNDPELGQFLSDDPRLSDENFARAFIAGANPDRLQQVSKNDSSALADLKGLSIESLNADGLNLFEEDSIDLALGNSSDPALKKSRIYKVDYEFMSTVKPGSYKALGESEAEAPLEKYVYGAVGYFAVPKPGQQKRPLSPIAIKITDGSSSSIVSPKDGWSWLIAKGMLNASHYTYHEGISHLGLTHLVLESVITSMKMILPKEHPIYHLLNKHTEGTRKINHSAFNSLIQPDRAVERLVGAKLKDPANGHQNTVWGLIAQVRSSFNFKDSYLETKIAKSGLNGIPDFPYRDDGKLVWTAIHNWVSNYVNHYYDDNNTDAANNKYPVKYDQEIQNWAANLSSTTRDEGGNLVGFGTNGKIESISELTDICTMVIFTASAQHAAVNFSQKTDMIYLPATPLAGYLSPKDFLKQKPGGHTQENYMQFLPPIDVAMVQCSMLEMLGSIFHTKLGYYDDKMGAQVVPYFKDPAIVAFNKTFQEELAVVEETINERNEGSYRSEWPYLTMLPTRIPQSINI